MVDVPGGDPPRLLLADASSAGRGRCIKAASRRARRAEADRVRAATLPRRLAARAFRASGGGRR